MIQVNKSIDAQRMFSETDARYIIPDIVVILTGINDFVQGDVVVVKASEITVISLEDGHVFT